LTLAPISGGHFNPAVSLVASAPAMLFPTGDHGSGPTLWKIRPLLVGARAGTSLWAQLSSRNH
jgi:glycerol uptake facilitator-like aquaporin